jgi:hypothetical protein
LTSKQGNGVLKLGREWSFSTVHYPVKWNSLWLFHVPVSSKVFFHRSWCNFTFSENLRSQGQVLSPMDFSYLSSFNWRDLVIVG